MLSESLPSTNTQDQARLLKALRESELLRELSELLASSLDPSHILQTLVRRTTEVCDVERCAVWLLDERHRQFLPSAYHFSTSNIKQRIIQAADYTWHHSTLPLDHPIIHRLFEEEGVLAISDLKQEKSMEAFAEKFFARSALLVALIRKDRPVGLMSLDNLARRTIFTPEQQQLARAVGQQAAVAIDNARLYYEAQEARKQAEKLSTRAQSIYQVAMAVNSGAELVQIMEVAREHLVQELQAQSAAIALLDDKGSLSILQRPEPRTPQTFPIAALTDCTHVMKQYQPYFLLQQQQSPTEQHLFRYLTMGNVMIVPLLVGQQNMQTQNTPLSQAISLTQRCVGFAFINYGQKHDAPDQDHYTFAQDIAAHCAMAIEKAAILTRAEHAARLATEHANTLDAIFNAMTEGLLVLDKQGKVVISNSSASRFLGLKRSGKKFLTDYLKRHKLYTPEGNTLPPEQFPALRALASESVRKERFLHKHNNGKEQILEANIAPLLDSGKEKIGVVSALRDITEQVRFETAMRESNALKDEFLAITAHEFRTPLTVILAHGQMMARLLSRTPDVAQELKERLHESLSIIEEQTRQLTNIVTVFLEVTYINRGQIDIAHEVVDLEEVARETVANYEATSTMHTISYAITQAQYPYVIQGDKIRLQQIFTNLIQNAIKYSPGGGPITITLAQRQHTRGQHTIEICVADTGIGIPQDAQQHLFERFYRAPNASQSNTRGVGLGLYLVSEFTQMHGGTIRVESSGIAGEGSRFWLTFPLLLTPTEGLTTD